MRIRRAKPYVCVDCDFDDHVRFLKTRDLDTAAGTWLRCLVHSRAQELDGVVPAVWLHRTFGAAFERIEELVAVGLLLLREDGDYEIHAYAPRNQTRVMMLEDRASARERMAATRRGKEGKAVRANKRKGSPEQGANKDRTSALVPTSTSLSTSSSPSSFSLHEVSASDRAEEVQEPESARDLRAKGPLPTSEPGLSGPFWLQAFTDGVRGQTGRPCTAGRLYFGTLERLVAHHAPRRDVASACDWLRGEARTFAAQWDGKHPAKGLTPDGLERWLNEGRQGPPEFGRPRVVQPSADEWHEDDWSDLGAEVVR